MHDAIILLIVIAAIVTVYKAITLWLRIKYPDKFPIKEGKASKLFSKDFDSTVFMVFFFIVFLSAVYGTMFVSGFADTESSKFILKVCEVVIIAMSGYYFRRVQEQQNGNGAK